MLFYNSKKAKVAGGLDWINLLSILLFSIGSAFAWANYELVGMLLITGVNALKFILAVWSTHENTKSNDDKAKEYMASIIPALIIFALGLGFLIPPHEYMVSLAFPFILITAAIGYFLEFYWSQGKPKTFSFLTICTCLVFMLAASFELFKPDLISLLHISTQTQLWLPVALFSSVLFFANLVVNGKCVFSPCEDEHVERIIADEKYSSTRFDSQYEAFPSGYYIDKFVALKDFTLCDEDGRPLDQLTGDIKQIKYECSKDIFDKERIYNRNCLWETKHYNKNRQLITTPPLPNISYTIDGRLIQFKVTEIEKFDNFKVYRNAGFEAKNSDAAPEDKVFNLSASQNPYFF